MPSVRSSKHGLSIILFSEVLIFTYNCFRHKWKTDYLINYCDPAWGVKHYVEWYLEILKAQHSQQGLLADRDYYLKKKTIAIIVSISFFFAFLFPKPRNNVAAASVSSVVTVSQMFFFLEVLSKMEVLLQ